MKSAEVEMFFSCSFSDIDKEIVNFIGSICRGLGIKLINVDRGFAVTPPEKAKEMIRNSAALIAVAVRRQETKDGEAIMPSAVREEITMAYATEKPILLLAETGIKLDGFMPNYCTHLPFKRDQIMHDFSILEKIVSSIHELKMNTLNSHDLLSLQPLKVSHYTEHFSYSQSLEQGNNEFYWDIGFTKKLIFFDKYSEGIREMHWAAYPVMNNEPLIKSWRLEFDNGSKNFKFKVTEDTSISGRISVLIEIDPKPERGDFIEYSGSFKSRNITPVFMDDLEGHQPCLKLSDKSYFCDEGIVPITRINRLITQFKFPKMYWDVIKGDVIPLAGHFSNRTDNLTEAEIARMNFRKEIFGTYACVTCEIDNPLAHHSYGMAWNPPYKIDLEKSNKAFFLDNQINAIEQESE